MWYRSILRNFWPNLIHSWLVTSLAGVNNSKICKFWIKTSQIRTNKTMKVRRKKIQILKGRFAFRPTLVRLKVSSIAKVIAVWFRKSLVCKVNFSTLTSTQFCFHISKGWLGLKKWTLQKRQIDDFCHPSLNIGWVREFKEASWRVKKLKRRCIIRVSGNWVIWPVLGLWWARIGSRMGICSGEESMGTALRSSMTIC